MKQLDTIHKYYSNDENVAINELVVAQKQYDEQERLLAELNNYQHQYKMTFSKDASAGININNLQNYNRFMNKLHSIILTQRENVDEKHKQLMSALDKWQLIKMKKSGIDKLRDRRIAQEIKSSLQQEQKQSDELVIQRYLRKEPHNDRS